MNEFFISKNFEIVENILIGVFFVGFVLIMIYKSKDPGFHRGNPFIEGGIKNKKIRLVVLIAGALFCIINLILLLLDKI